MVMQIEKETGQFFTAYEKVLTSLQCCVIHKHNGEMLAFVHFDIFFQDFLKVFRKKATKKDCLGAQNKTQAINMYSIGKQKTVNSLLYVVLNICYRLSNNFCYMKNARWA